jgi:hypothetical protein
MSNGIVGDGVDEQSFELLERARLECLNLLDSARFSTWKGLHLNGALTAISILPRPDREDPDTCRIELICHGAGHIRVEWERVPLELVDTESERVLYRGVLDARGRSMFKVPSGGPQERYLRFRHPEPPDVEFEFRAELLALAGGGPDELPPLKESDRLSVELILVPERTLRIIVKALDASLQNGAVVVDIRSRQTSAIAYSATIPLEFDEGMRGKWDIQVENLGFSVDDILIVEVRPKSN